MTPQRDDPSSESPTMLLSTVHRGVAFEQRSLQLLQAHLSMALRRVGGRSDGGIDLIGWWWLPFDAESTPNHRPGALPDSDGLLRRRLRVLAQCKAEKKKFTPKYVREMEGVWHHHSKFPSPPSSMHSESLDTAVYPTVALLISESIFSQSTLLHAYRSTIPFLLIHLPPSSTSGPTPATASSTEIGAICPNPTLTRLVNPLTFLWERNPSLGSSTETDPSIAGRPGLWWQGCRLFSWTPDFPDSDTI